MIGSVLAKSKELYKRNPISFSIWLMPRDSLKLHISKVINTISEEHGGPIFEPHVTLVGGFLGKEIDLVKKAETLSKTVSSFNVIFNKLNYLDEFFRSFFWEVKFTDELKSARNIACKEFDCYETDYLPHMSLVYGNYDLSTKLQMAKKIDKIPGGFLADKIFLANNNEIDLRWEIIDCFDLIS